MGMLDTLPKNHRENLTLVLALSRGYQSFLRAIGPTFRDAGLTASQWDVLEVLHSKGPQTVNTVMQAALSTSGNLDVVIKNLEKSGLVTKAIDPKDRRSRIISLTKAGAAKMRAFYPVHNEALQELFSPLARSDKRELIKLLNALRKSLQKPETFNVG